MYKIFKRCWWFRDNKKIVGDAEPLNQCYSAYVPRQVRLIQNRQSGSTRRSSNIDFKWKRIQRHTVNFTKKFSREKGEQPKWTKFMATIFFLLTTSVSLHLCLTLVLYQAFFVTRLTKGQPPVNMRMKPQDKSNWYHSIAMGLLFPYTPKKQKISKYDVTVAWYISQPSPLVRRELKWLLSLLDNLQICF